MAVLIAAAFGTSQEVWLNLENTYRLSKVPAPGPEVLRRAKAAG
jgi:plasmid maintenance system antidote protein VapI